MADKAKTDSNNLAEAAREMVLEVIFASDALGFCRAETGRILGIKCEDIGRLFEGCLPITQGTTLWQHAVELVELHRLLETYACGDTIQMFHWLRKRRLDLGESPFILIVDQGEIHKVIALLLRLIRDVKSNDAEN